MKIPEHDRCFVCGENSEIGLDFSNEDGWVCSPFQPTENLVGFEGIVHGGIVASVLAEAMGMAVALQERKFLAKRISIEYDAPVKPGSPYRVCGRVDRRDGRKIFALAYLYDKNGVLCAEAEGLFIALNH
ncbi:MAG: PaaI family thioesterase [Thermotogae bacterium]|nr:PaaI family thioesterase [Thermotogota bacterium]